MQEPRAFHTAALLPNGKVLIAGGAPTESPSSTAELFDSASLTFTAAGTMTDARAGHAAVLFPSGKVLLTSGIDAFNMDGTSGFALTAEIYDPSAGSFRRHWRDHGPDTRWPLSDYSRQSDCIARWRRDRRWFGSLQYSRNLQSCCRQLLRRRTDVDDSRIGTSGQFGEVVEGLNARTARKR